MYEVWLDSLKGSRSIEEGISKNLRALPFHDYRLITLSTRDLYRHYLSIHFCLCALYLFTGKEGLKPLQEQEVQDQGTSR
jgi:hypothetical protein